MLKKLNLLKSIPKDLWQLAKDLLAEFIQFCKEVSQKSKNLTLTNYVLGFHHLNLTNINDAILRFRVVEFLTPNYKDTKYQLARSYIYANKSDQAIVLLRQLEKNEVIQYRLDVIEQKPIKNIPIEIIKEDFDFLANRYNKFCKDENYTTPEQIVSKLGTVITKDMEISIIDVGCGTGRIASVIENNFNIKIIDGIDISSQMVDRAKKLNIYNNLYIEDFNNFKAITKYNLVIASCSLNYSKNFLQALKNLKKMMLKNAILAIAVEISEIEDFSYENANFLFSEREIREAISETKLEILIAENIIIQKNTKGMLLVLKN